MIALSFRPQEPPLAPHGVVAFGSVVQVLATAALDRDDDEFALFDGVADDNCLVLFCANPTVLPWADGCLYLGQVPHAPLLWFPTTIVPTLPLDLLSRAIRRAQGEHASACIVIPSDDGSIEWVSLRHRGPIDRQRLAAHAAASR